MQKVLRNTNKLIMDNQIFEHYREIQKSEQQAKQLLLKLGYVIGDREAIDETVMLIKSRKIDLIDGVDLIIKELNENDADNENTKN